jgi:cold shock CspA family protein
MSDNNTNQPAPSAPLKPLAPARPVVETQGEPVRDMMRRLEMALDGIHQDEGEPDVEPPVNRPMFGADSVTKKVLWKDNLFGSITIVSEFGLGNAISLDRFTMIVPLFVTGQPTTISFSLTKGLAKGVHLYRAQNAAPVDCTEGELVKFSVPVEWKQGDRRMIPNLIPKTRDVDLMYLDTTGNGDGRKGVFIVVEIQLCTRGGRFYISIQQVYAGQVVTTTVAHAEKAGLQTVQVGSHLGSVIPLFPENAYPGTSIFKNFGYLAEDIVKSALDNGAFVPLSKCVVARWAPEQKPLPKDLRSEDGWHVANVSWFNPVVGYGFLYCDDKESCFVHFKQIETGRTDFPHLTPMRAVAVRYEPKPEGSTQGRKAAAVRPI